MLCEGRSAEAITQCLKFGRFQGVWVDCEEFANVSDILQASMFVLRCVKLEGNEMGERWYFEFESGHLEWLSRRPDLLKRSFVDAHHIQNQEWINAMPKPPKGGLLMEALEPNTFQFLTHRSVVGG